MKIFKFMATVALALIVCVTPVFADDIDNQIISGGGNGTYNVPQDPVVTPIPQNTTPNTPDVNSTTQGTQKLPQGEDYAGNLFGDVELNMDNSYAEPAIRSIRAIVSIVVSVVVSILPLWVVFSTMIDTLCILASPIMWAFANLMPIQLFSAEVSQVTGVQFAGQTGGTPAPAKDIGNQNKYVWYFKEKFITCFFAFLMVVLVSTGVYFDILNWVINMIVGAITSFLPA